MLKDKILVVDDEQMIRWTLSEALRGWGYLPIETSTVAATMPAFESEQPAAVLLDINLPDGSGLDVLREIKRRQPDAVVIRIKPKLLLDSTIGSMHRGAHDFIGKPFNLDQLQVTIRNEINAQH